MRNNRNQVLDSCSSPMPAESGATERGWIVERPDYGKWFISRAAVIADWKQDSAQAYPDEPKREPTAEEVEIWFAEQITWIEVAACGRQLERPDMVAVERAWMVAMKRDADYVSLVCSPVETEHLPAHSPS